MTRSLLRTCKLVLVGFLVVGVFTGSILLHGIVACQDSLEFIPAMKAQKPVS